MTPNIPMENLVTVDEQYLNDLAERLRDVSPGDTYEPFRDVDETFWLWANTTGYRDSTELQAILPDLPSLDMQLRFTGKSGDDTLAEGHSLAAELKVQYEIHRGPLTPDTRILEFGCGWGRIIRFFLKDVRPDNLWGIDCNEELVSFCKQSNPGCNFERNDPLPPTDLADQSFDLIYAYSLFTHLSEPAHLGWLAELRRLLAPGGLLVVTVRPRHFISYCGKLTNDTELSHESQASLVGMFADTESALRDYDAGRFCYEPYRSSSYGDDWGEACISRPYVERRWADRFELLGFIEDLTRFKQHLVVLRSTTQAVHVDQNDPIRWRRFQST